MQVASREEKMYTHISQRTRMILNWELQNINKMVKMVDKNHPFFLLISCSFAQKYILISWPTYFLDSRNVI